MKIHDDIKLNVILETDIQDLQSLCTTNTEWYNACQVYKTIIQKNFVTRLVPDYKDKNSLVYFISNAEYGNIKSIFKKYINFSSLQRHACKFSVQFKANYNTIKPMINDFKHYLYVNGIKIKFKDLQKEEIVDDLWTNYLLKRIINVSERNDFIKNIRNYNQY